MGIIAAGHILLAARVGCVLNLQFDALAAAPGIAAQVAGDVQRHPARRHQKIAQWLPGGPKCDAVEARAVAAFENDADVGFAR